MTNGPAKQFVYESGDLQSAPVNTPFGAPLKAIVEDATGHPVDGKLVSLSFTAVGGAGLLGAYPSQLSGSDGVPGEVSFPVIANATAGGPYPVTLTAFLGANGTPTLTYNLTNTPATSNRVLSLVSGGNTSTAEGNPPTPRHQIKVKVTDGSNNPVPNVPVQLFGPSGPGARADFGLGATSTSQNTDGTGVATFPYSVPCGLGPYNLVATTLNAQNTLSIGETSIAGAASSVQVQSGNPQSTPVNTNFALPLSVKVLDNCNNPVAQGTTVTFTAVPVGGASLASSPLTAQTDANGNASVTAAANTITGSYTVTAASGAATPATFNLTNTAGPVTSCTFVNGSTPTATVGMTFMPADFAVQAVDSFGNAVNGAPVLYTVPATGNPSVTGLTGGNTSGTGANAGRFTPTGPVTANTMAGSYPVTATAAGVACGTRSVTNTAGAFSQIIIGTPGAPITALNGFTDSAVIGQFFTKPIPFFIADQYGNPVPGVMTVTFSAPPDLLTNPTAAGTGGLTAPTGTNGQGTFAPASGTGFKAKNVPGSYNITATSGAITNSTVIQYTNLATPVASCSFVNPGNTRTAVVGGTFTPLSNFAVQALDAGSAPVNGAPVTYTVNPVGGATLTGLTGGNTSGTGASAGQFTPTGPLTAGSTAGAYTVGAAIGNINCGTITVTNTAGAPANVTFIAPGGPPYTPAGPVTLTAGAPASGDLRVRVTDANGNPVPGATLTFGYASQTGGAVPTAKSTGCGTATPPVTGADGTYDCGPILPGNVPGTATIQATATTTGANAGSASGTSPLITVVAGVTAQSCAFTNGAPITGVTTGGTFPANAFQVKVTDGPSGTGNPVTGAPITYTASNASGATATGFSSPSTDGTGQASPTGETASGTAGTFTVSATTPGVGGGTLNCGSITVTTTAPGGGGSGYTLKILHIPGFPPGHGRVGSGFGRSTALVVKLVDANGNGVSDFINFTILSGGTAPASFNGAVPTKTLADGTATVYVSAGASAGTFSIQVTSPKLSGTVTDFTNSLTDTTGRNLIEPFVIS